MFVITTFIVVFSFLMINRVIKNKRIIHINSLISIYDCIEYDIIVNKITPNNDLINFLKGFKNIVKNPELADIQVLLFIISKSKNNESMRKRYDKVLNNLPESTQTKIKGFNVIVEKLIILSMLKPDFIFYALRKSITLLFESGFNKLKQNISSVNVKMKFEPAFISSNSLNSRVLLSAA